MATPILGLNQYTAGQDFDFNDVNGDYGQIDTLPPTVCTSGTRPASNLYQGRTIYETDTDLLYMWDTTGTAGWRLLAPVDRLLPAPVRGYFITAAKSVTQVSPTWADVANDNAKSITTPYDCMVHIQFRCDLTGASGTPMSVRLAWTGATTGDSVTQMDSAILGGLTATSAGERQSLSVTLKVLAGTTNFKLQAQRSNTTNATSVNAAAIAITPFNWGALYVGGAA